jgi:hypothetical protein
VPKQYTNVSHWRGDWEPVNAELLASGQWYIERIDMTTGDAMCSAESQEQLQLPGGFFRTQHSSSITSTLHGLVCCYADFKVDFGYGVGVRENGQRTNYISYFRITGQQPVHVCKHHDCMLQMRLADYDATYYPEGGKSTTVSFSVSFREINNKSKTDVQSQVWRYALSGDGTYQLS